MSPTVPEQTTFEQKCIAGASNVSDSALAVVIGAWLLVLGISFGCLFWYQATPGSVGAAPSQWPASSQLKRSPNTATLLMFAHPRCSCTQASLRELAVILAGARTLYDVRVIFCRPDHVDDSWRTAPNVRRAQNTSGVTIHWDRGGEAARLFGANTSGHVMFFDRDGVLRFSGGITASRAHEGDNVGRSAVSALVEDESVDVNRTPVFGCALTEPDSSDVSEGP